MADSSVPEFITPEEEDFLTRKIKASPLPKWKTVGTGRRIQYWGGNMSKNGVLLPEPMPDFLSGYPDIIERIRAFLSGQNGATSDNEHLPGDQAQGQEGESLVSSTARLSASTAMGSGLDQGLNLDVNQVLVNEYQPHHSISDGPAFQPLVATISLGSHTILDLYHYVSPTSPSPPMTASLPATEPGATTNTATATTTNTTTTAADPVTAPASERTSLAGQSQAGGTSAGPEVESSSMAREDGVTPPAVGTGPNSSSAGSTTKTSPAETSTSTESAPGHSETTSHNSHNPNRDPNPHHDGKSIAAIPLAHILLRPRSLFILSSSLYTSHLHGIQGRMADDLTNLSPGMGKESLDDDGGASHALRTGSATRSEQSDKVVAINDDDDDDDEARSQTEGRDPSSDSKLEAGKASSQDNRSPGEDTSTEDHKSRHQVQDQRPNSASNRSQRSRPSIANTDLIGDATTLDALRDGTWREERGERISLTFRHANRVIKGGALGLAQAALMRR